MTYTYKCNECGKIEDKVHGMNESPKFICCKKEMKKQFTAPLGVHGANTGNRKGT